MIINFIAAKNYDFVLNPTTSDEKNNDVYGLLDSKTDPRIRT